MSQRLAVALFAVALIISWANTVCGQDYPTRPIRIVTAPAGGGNDLIARLIAQGISGSLGQPAIVDNRPVPILGGLVAKAPADGYTLLVAGGTFVLQPLLEKTPYDPVKDFSPITLVELQISVVVVHPSVPANSVKELIALARAKPGVLNYASSGNGGALHLSGELFNSMAGVNIVHVPYKGTGPAINDLLAGQVQLMFASPSAIAAHVKSGKLRALAVTGAEPTPMVPGLPTVAATVPGYESASLTGVYAPAGTPVVIINRLNQEIVRVLHRPDVKEKLTNSGVDVLGSSPERLTAAIKADTARWGKVIKDANIKLD